MIDPTIWKHRAEITVAAAVHKALDRGVKIDDVETIVRESTPHPFGSAAPDSLVMRTWYAALDEAFGPKLRRRRKRHPPQ